MQQDAMNKKAGKLCTKQVLQQITWWTLADKNICGGGEGFYQAGTGVVVKEGQERLEGDK